MMNKKRLEELKDWKMNLNETLVLNGHEISGELKEKTRKYRDLLDYAIEQAQQVQELEEIKSEAIKQIDVTQRRNKRLEERVQELEKDIKEWEIVNESWEEINTQIVEQNKRYREVIKETLQAMGMVDRQKYGSKLEKALEEPK